MIDHALILTAGLGTRLRPLTDVRAKPAIPVAGEPMVRRILRWLAGHGARDVVLNLHHLPETLTAAVGDGSDLGVRVRYSWEQPVVLGVAGGPRQALPIVGADTFLLINGDVLTDVDLAALAGAHRASGARVTLALAPNRRPDKYSGVRLAADGCVTGFAPRGESGSYLFVSTQAVQASVFEGLPAGQPARSVGGIYDRLIAEEPGAIRGFVSDVAFWDVGTAADYWATNWAFAERQHGVAEAAGPTVRMAPSARVSRSILWDDVEIGSGAIVDECIVTDGVRVPGGARYHRAMLIRGADGAVRPYPLSL